MANEEIRITRYVKIGGKWLFAAVPLDRAGRPDAKAVVYKGQRIEVKSGSFYVDHGDGKSRRRKACGSDVEAVRRALRTQSHVMEPTKGPKSLNIQCFLNSRIIFSGL